MSETSHRKVHPIPRISRVDRACLSGGDQRRHRRCSMHRPLATASAARCATSRRCGTSSGPTRCRSTSSAQRRSTCSGSTAGSATSPTSPTTTAGTVRIRGSSRRSTSRTSSSKAARRSTTGCWSILRCGPTCRGQRRRANDRRSPWCSSTPRPSGSARSSATTSSCPQRSSGSTWTPSSSLPGWATRSARQACRTCS